MCLDIWKRLSAKRDRIYVIDTSTCTVIRIEDFAAGQSRTNIQLVRTYKYFEQLVG